MKNEFYDTAMRKKIYNSLFELQKDLDIWLRYYNNERPHSGKYCYGKTPMQTFKDIVNSGEVGDVVTSRRLPTIAKVILYFTLFGCKK